MFGNKNTVPTRLNKVLESVEQRKKLDAGRLLDRDKTFAECSITSPTGETSTGIVIDHSKTGLRVRFRNHYRLPRFVSIRVARLGVHRNAEVMWQDKGDAGLKYY